MTTAILFEEVQASGKKSLRDFFKVTSVLFVVALAFNLFRQEGEINQFTSALLVGLLFCALAAILTSTKMVTQIRRDGIYVRFPPFQPSFHKYSWENIDVLYLRNFDAVSEYRGWGIKAGPAGKGYIVSGDKGLQLELRDNSNVLLGTQRPAELANVLRALNKLT